MEIINASCSCSNLHLLHQHWPRLRVPALGAGYLHSLTTSANYSHTFQRPLQALPLPLNLNIRLNSFRKPINTSRSLTDDTASANVEADPSLGMKKKAMEVSPELKGTSIFLVGIHSNVKTSLGKLLADALRYYYFDSDNLVEEAAGGNSAINSFRQRDEEGFRVSETEVLKQLSSMGRLVVCAGNGAVQNATNLAFLRHGISIWVDVPLDMIAREVLEDGTQLASSEIFNSGSYSEIMSQLTTLYEEMQGGYATADATVSLQNVASQLGYDDLIAVTTEDMAFEVLKEIDKLTRVKRMMEAAARPF